MAKAPSSKSAFLLDVDLRFQYLRFQCVFARFRKSALPPRQRFFISPCIIVPYFPTLCNIAPALQMFSAGQRGWRDCSEVSPGSAGRTSHRTEWLQGWASLRNGGALFWPCAPVNLCLFRRTNAEAGPNTSYAHDRKVPSILKSLAGLSNAPSFYNPKHTHESRDLITMLVKLHENG